MSSPARTTAAHGLVDHVCHVHDGPAALTAHGVPYLAAGIRLGQRPVIVAPEHQLAAARQLGDAATAAAGGGGTVEIATLGAVYGDGPVDVGATLERFTTVLSTAITEGYSGLRALYVVTDAARDPDRRRAFAAWEHLAGQWQSSLPIASACAYDRRILGDAVVQELACLHPRAVGSLTPVPFRLYSRRGRLVLDGEVDTFAAPLLQRAVSHLRLVPGERLVIDARGLTFVNHRGLEVLVEGLARRAGGLTLLGTNAVTGLLLDRLGVPPELVDVLPWVG